MSVKVEDYQRNIPAGITNNKASVSWYFSLFCGLLLICVGWAIMQPVYGMQDEEAHTTWAYAVVTGQALNGENFVKTKRYLYESSAGCFAYHQQEPSDCQTSMRADQDDLIAVNTSAYNYLPEYYFLVGIPLKLIPGSVGFYLARCLSAVIFCVLTFVGLIQVSNRTTRPKLTSVALLALITPMTVALAGSINPQALEIGAGIAFAGCAAPLAFDNVSIEDTKKLLRLIALVLPIFIISRSPAPLWAVLLSLLIFITLPLTRVKLIVTLKEFWIALGTAVISCFAVVAWLKIAPMALVPGVPIGSRTEVFSMYLWHKIPLFVEQAIGNAAYLNAPLPRNILLGYLLFLFCVIVYVLMAQKRRLIVATIFWVICLPVSATVIQLSNWQEVGEMWQGRYWLPFLVPALWIVASGAINAYAQQGISKSRKPIRVALLASSVLLFASAWLSHVMLFKTALVRYSVGLPGRFQFSVLEQNELVGLGFLSVGILILGVTYGYYFSIKVKNVSVCYE